MKPSAQVVSIAARRHRRAPTERPAPALPVDGGHPGPGLATARRAATSAPRSFDPVLVGRLECDAWVAYYRRDWLGLLRPALTLSRRVFGLSWPTTVRCSWLALRATRLWAPLPDNDPNGARRAMEHFYRIVQRRYAVPFDPATAATLEVQWWRVHREAQHTGASRDDRALVDALAKLYAHIYGVSEASVRPAADQRALAMRHSDRWIREGCRLDSPLIDRERTALIRSYAALLAATEHTVVVRRALDLTARSAAGGRSGRSDVVAPGDLRGRLDEVAV